MTRTKSVWRTISVVGAGRVSTGVWVVGFIVRKTGRGILVELGALRGGERRGQRQKPAVVGHDLLPLATQDEAQKLPQLRLDRRAGLATEINVDAAHERIGAVAEALATRRDVGA